MSYTAYNVRTKRKEKMDNPKLVTKSNKGRTTYLLTAPGSDGTALWRIISHEQAANFKKGVSSPRKSYPHVARKSTGSKKRRSTRKRRSSGSKKRRSTHKRRSGGSKHKSRRRRRKSGSKKRSTRKRSSGGSKRKTRKSRKSRKSGSKKRSHRKTKGFSFF